MASGISHAVNLDDLEKAVKTRQLALNAKMSMIEEFVQAVQNDLCIRENDAYMFNFLEVPEFVSRTNYKRADYEGVILKLLMKVKVRYLAEKAREFPDKPLNKIVITDDDRIPLELFFDIVATIKNKNAEQRETINEFIKECKDAVAQTI